MFPSPCINAALSSSLSAAATAMPDMAVAGPAPDHPSGGRSPGSDDEGGGMSLQQEVEDVKARRGHATLIDSLCAARRRKGSHYCARFALL